MEKTNRYFLIAFIAIVIIILVIRLYVIKGDCFNLFKKPIDKYNNLEFKGKQDLFLCKFIYEIFFIY